MRLALVAGGWHFPHQFYRRAPLIDRYCIAHRDVNLNEVWKEKRLARGLDARLYANRLTRRQIDLMGWRYEEAPNTAGDWVFLNQWLERHDYMEYDAILFAHDDTYWLNPNIRLPDGDWLAVGNGRYPEAPEGYLRGSFEIFRRELLDMLGGRIPVGTLPMTREGETNTPEAFDALSPWNSTCEPLRQWFVENKLTHRVAYLSRFYRISRHAIEGERGWLHKQEGAPWSYSAGLKHYGVAA